MIYLDYNRTTPLAPSVLEAMAPYWATHFMLPDQQHAHAQLVGEALENAREGLAGLVGCEPFELVFTGGGTESNNLAILGILSNKPPGQILVSALEHDSVLGAAKSLGSGWQVKIVPCDESGVMSPRSFESMLSDETRLVCLQAANPIVGTVQPVRKVADIAHTRGVPVHCDATQIFGKIPLDISHLRADTVSVSGHKFYGPKGTGALFVRRGLEVSPISFGEPREMGVRAGAENVPGCVGLGAAATLASRCVVDVADNLHELRDRMANGLRQVINTDLKILCDQSPRLPNTLAFQLGCDAQLIQKSARHLAFATAQSDEPPDEMTRTLKAIGCSESDVSRTIRISVGWTTSRDQVDRAVELLAEAWDGAAAG